MSSESPKQTLFVQFAAVAKAAAHPHRLALLEQLAQGERSVEVLADRAKLSIANASQHLQMLKQSNLVQVRRDGNFIRYRLAGDNVYKSWKDLRTIGMESLAEIDKLIKDFRTQKNSLEPVSLQELLPRMRAKKIILLDVRPEQEFKAGHIPNAINIPIDQLATRIGELSKSRQYIAYCRGPFCVFADDAVQILTRKGFKASRLEEGYPDWKIDFAAENYA